MPEQPWTVAPGSTLTSSATHALQMPSQAADSSVMQFLNRVIWDGRFLDTVIENPRCVADALGIELSAETEARVKERPLKEHLAEFYAGFARVGPIAIIGVVILAGIVAVVAWKYSTAAMHSPVTDTSAYAHAKL